MSQSVGVWPLDFRAPHTWEFYLRPNSQIFKSPVTRTSQAIEGQGQMWVATGSWLIKDRRDAQKFEAFIDKLRGTVNYCHLPDFADRGQVLGPCTDVSTLGQVSFEDTSGFDDGSYFSGGSGGLSIYGHWPLGARQVLIVGAPQNSSPLYAGDNVQLGSFLYRLTDDAVTNRVNRAYLRLNRGLLEEIDHGSAIITRNARTPMRLVDDDQTKRSIDAQRQVREYTLTFEEIFFLNDSVLFSSPTPRFEESENGTQGDFIVDAHGTIWSLR